MVEHPHVYTLGNSGRESNMLVSDEFLRSIGAELLPYRPGRGHHLSRIRSVGSSCPIFSDLERLGRSLKEYVWTVEECVMPDRGRVRYRGRAARSGATGRPWIEGDTPRARKICAIGVKASRYVTMHGFALNADHRSALFLVHQSLRLCRQGGYLDLGKTTGARPSLEEVARRFAAHFGELCRGCRVSCSTPARAGRAAGRFGK